MRYGDPQLALDLYDRALELYHQCGNGVATAQTILSLARTFNGLERPDTAVILLGAAARHLEGDPDTMERLRNTLGHASYEHHFATGAAMDLPEAPRFARYVEAARHQRHTSPSQA